LFSSCFIYVFLSIELLSDKDTCLLKFTSITRNRVNAYTIITVIAVSICPAPQANSIPTW